MIDRIKTHIPGFDELVDGGIPKHSIVLLTGSAGAGKTIFAIQSLYYGATVDNEKGLYISFEESEESIRLQAKVLGWDLAPLEEKGLLRLKSIPTTEFSLTKANKTIEAVVNEFKPQRVVLDSISIFGVFAEFAIDLSTLQMHGFQGKDSILVPRGEIMTRKAIAEIIHLVSKINATSILISELPADSKWLSRDTISEYLVDGIIKLEYSGGDRPRALTVAKMRKTKIDNCPRPFDLTDKGVHIYSKEKVYSSKGK
ncbi:MAG: ATPase domain-containing protein [Candidatus Micrarchaeota archaeon]